MNILCGRLSRIRVTGFEKVGCYRAFKRVRRYLCFFFWGFTGRVYVGWGLDGLEAFISSMSMFNSAGALVSRLS